MDDKELQLITERISIELFNKPFMHKAYFNNRLRTTGGRYLLRTHNIELNRESLLKHGKNELIGIVKHELCHYHLHIEGKGYKHKDKDFKELLAKVDAPRFCKSVRTKKKVVKGSTYLYVCTSCGIQYERKRKIDTTRYVCGKCNSKILLV